MTTGLTRRALLRAALPALALSAAARKVEDMFDHPQVLAEDMIGTIEQTVIGPAAG